MNEIENVEELPILEGEFELNTNGQAMFRNLQAAHSYCRAFKIFNYNLRTQQDGTVVVLYNKENV